MRSNSVRGPVAAEVLSAKKSDAAKLCALATTGLLVMGMSTVTIAADVKISGWIFQTAVDRDSAEDIEFQPLGNSGNQITFDVTHDLGNGLTAGYNLRIATFTDDVSDVNLDQRSVRLSGSFGTLDLGQNLTASAFLDSYDDTPTYWIDPMGWLNRTGATGESSLPGLASSLTTGGTTRDDRLRYVSPTFSGLTARLQFGDNDSNEIGLTYSNYGITANLFAIDGGSVAEDTTGFLIAYNAPFGLHAVYTASEQDRATSGKDKVSGWKVGYSLGKHTVSYSMHTFEDGAADDYERDSLSYVYQFNKSFQLFAQSTREERGSLDDDAIAIGAGIFF